MKTFATLSLGLALFSRVTAQGVRTEVVCGASYDWMTNSIGQSPCLVSAYIGAACTSDNSFDTEPLNSTQVYAPPTEANATPCQCNSVFYSLAQACAVCQGSSPNNWYNWNSTCAADGIPAVVGLPIKVPAGTQIPPWAYIDPTISPTWSAALAFSYESSPSGSITPGVTPTPSSTTTSSSPTPTIPSASPTPSRTHKSTPVGAIIGGVLGGISIVVLGIIVVVWLMKGNGNAAHRYQGRQANLVDTQAPLPDTAQQVRASVINPGMAQYTPYDPTNVSSWGGTSPSTGNPQSDAGRSPTNYPTERSPPEYAHSGGPSSATFDRSAPEKA